MKHSCALVVSSDIRRARSPHLLLARTPVAAWRAMASRTPSNSGAYSSLSIVKRRSLQRDVRHRSSFRLADFAAWASSPSNMQDTCPKQRPIRAYGVSRQCAPSIVGASHEEAAQPALLLPAWWKSRPPANPLFLREEELRQGIEFCSTPSATSRPRPIWCSEPKLGRGHQRAPYFDGRQPGAGR